ncbi:MAG: FGGY-family carbohydrate kinase [Christensenella sp.]|uniref:FGGY-family carbohydrate kinase n=1 Tax=Christensenella sp. TaxID=1935934 RepID=UPI002B1FDFFC|nr:FGGY-family carbohydrate kinase [Christensenella sp.]MEA5004488.1 FGGY-family carbohydrate kinase [Christensenella sp.]
MYFCGLDVGTSGVKAVVFDEKGNEKKRAYREYDFLLRADGTRSLDAENIWKKTKIVLREAAGPFGKLVAAISVSSFGEAFVVLDGSDKVLCEVMVSTDRRGEREFEEEMKRIGSDEIISVCGLVPSPTYSLAKLLYLKKRKKEVCANAKRVLLIGDFIQYRLSGCAAVDCSSACRTMLFDIEKAEWSDRLFQVFDMKRSLFSPAVFTGEIVGKLLLGVARETGLSPSAKVVAGGHDQPVNAIGAGLRKNTVACSMGTSECMTPVFEKRPAPGVTKETNLPAELVWEKGKYCTLAYNPTSGLLIKWFFDTFSDEKSPPYALFEKNMPKAPTGIMVQPYLMGSGTPYMDASARMAITGIDIGTDRYMLYKAILEGLVFDQKLNLEKIRMLGVRAERLVCTGGGCNSKAWLQLKADILQIPVSVLTTSEAGALGCAAVCAAALGEYGSIEEAAQNMSVVRETLEPAHAFDDFYQEKFSLYRHLRDDVKEESEFGCAAVMDTSIQRYFV